MKKIYEAKIELKVDGKYVFAGEYPNQTARGLTKEEALKKLYSYDDIKKKTPNVSINNLPENCSIYEFDVKAELDHYRNRALDYINFFERVLSLVPNNYTVTEDASSNKAGDYLIHSIHTMKKDIENKEWTEYEVINNHHRGNYPFSICELEGRNVMSIYRIGTGLAFPSQGPSMTRIESYSHHRADLIEDGHNSYYFFGNPKSNFLVDTREKNAEAAIAYSLIGKGLIDGCQFYTFPQTQ